MTDEELQQLREQTDKSDRLDEAAESTETQDLQETIERHLEDIEDGDRQKTLSVWDGGLAALFAALEETEHEDDLAVVVESLREAFEIEDDSAPDRSEVLRLAVRLGLREAAPEYTNALREAVRNHASRGI
jgi:hypothetical protein